MSNPVEPGRTSAKIGIFRRVAVEQYMRPLDSDTPEMLAPFNNVLLALAAVLLCVAFVLLFSP